METAEYIAIDGKLYPHDAFLAAMNTVAMELVERAIPEGASLRRVGRNLAGLKRPSVAAAVRAEAINRVVREVPAVDAPKDAAVVAAFRRVHPGLDKRTAP